MKKEKRKKNGLSVCKALWMCLSTGCLASLVSCRCCTFTIKHHMNNSKAFWFEFWAFGKCHFVLEIVYSLVPRQFHLHSQSDAFVRQFALAFSHLRETLCPWRRCDRQRSRFSSSHVLSLQVYLYTSKMAMTIWTIVSTWHQKKKSCHIRRLKFFDSFSSHKMTIPWRILTLFLHCFDFCSLKHPVAFILEIHCDFICVNSKLFFSPHKIPILFS